MSDLCHNCGSCHLGTHPTKCRDDLQYCMICQNMGHTFNFCPTSVRQMDINFQYYMLCHNCDQWHLPNPCPIPLVDCSTCYTKGHLRHYCPKDPIPRFKPADSGADAGNKRRRGNDLESSRQLVSIVPRPEQNNQVLDIAQVHPNLLVQLRWNDAMFIRNLLQSQTIDQIVAGYHHMAQEAGVAAPGPGPQQDNAQPAVPTVPGRHDEQAAVGHLQGSMSGQETSQMSPTQAPPQQFEKLQQQDQRNDSINPPTPAPSSAIAKEQQPSQGLAVQGNSEADQEQLAQAGLLRDELQQQATEAGPPPAEATPTDIITATPKKKKQPVPRKPKATGPTRCDACKRQHKRCNHMKVDGQPYNPSETTPIPEGSSPVTAPGTLRPAATEPPQESQRSSPVYNDGHQSLPAANVAMASVEQDPASMMGNHQNQMFYQGTHTQAGWAPTSSADMGMQTLASAAANVGYANFAQSAPEAYNQGSFRPATQYGHDMNTNFQQAPPDFHAGNMGDVVAQHQQQIFQDQQQQQQTFQHQSSPPAGGDIFQYGQDGRVLGPADEPQPEPTPAKKEGGGGARKVTMKGPAKPKTARKTEVKPKAAAGTKASTKPATTKQKRTKKEEESDYL